MSDRGRSWPAPPRPPRPASLELVSNFNQIDERNSNIYSQNNGNSNALPQYNDKDQFPNRTTPQVAPKRRKGFNPLKFLIICFRSSCTLSKIVNCLWPIVPVAFAAHFAMKKEKLGNFILPYIAMIPAANLLGFAGREFATNLPRVIGVLVEITFGSVVELILLLILVKRGQKEVPVIQAAILGSILANLLLCLGMCFFVGGLRRVEQEFHEAIGEVGNGLMLVAGMALVLPAIFSSAAKETADVENKILKISRGTSVLLLLAYVIFVFFQMRSHHNLYQDIFETDEAMAHHHREKLTLIEAGVAVAISITIVTFMAYYLVEGIPYIVEKRGIKDAFVGLIMVPLVEKAAEHITAVDEAYDNNMNSALAHVLGSSIQTALLNTPLVVLVGWGMNVPMNLNFPIFDAAVLILAIIVVGNFLRDGKSNYLEGALCVIVYMSLALAAFYYPNANHELGGVGGGAHKAEGPSPMATATAAAKGGGGH